MPTWQMRLIVENEVSIIKKSETQEIEGHNAFADLALSQLIVAHFLASSTILISLSVRP